MCLWTAFSERVFMAVCVTVGEVMSDRLGSAYRLSEKYGVTMLAKSADTFAVDGGKVYLCTEGTTALAKGGSGDVESLQEMLLTLCHDFCMTLKTPTRLY